MALCGPSCAVPSLASTPSVGFGSAGFGGLVSRGLGLRPFPLAESSSSLGTLAGVIPSCINQIPASEVIIQPPPAVVTIPGPILSASCDPVAVGGNTPCAIGGYGQGLPTGLLGAGGLVSRLGRHYNFVGRRGSICYSPC
ncbi:feather keratin-like [Crotalus adamanteus]|uniref:Feather keratin-like n=1 Tax=Crotalus adamanteus TaxID=8729 RepID=A0AAW1AMI7_CROAD